MNINDMTKDVDEAIKSYKKSDHIMMRKTFQMKDVLYKKSAPSKELWRSEVAFDVNFCLLAVAAVSAVLIILAASVKAANCLHGLMRRMCRTRKGR